MPRIAESRGGAEPSSSDQRARQGRILEVAAELGGETELARVQMHEVAKRAGVAIGTLYRYFPSKTHLFVAVMLEQIDRIGVSFATTPPAGNDPCDAVCEVLVRTTRALLRRRALSTAMIQSASTANVAVVPDAGKIDPTFRRIVLDAAGIQNPTDQDVSGLRLLMQLWLGVIAACLNGRISVDEAEADIRQGCSLLLVNLSRQSRTASDA